MPKLLEGGKIRVPAKDIYVKPEYYDELEFVMIDDFTYRLLCKRDALLEHRRVLAKVTYDGEYLTIPKEILECYDTDIVFVYVQYMSLHIQFKKLKYWESVELLDDEWLERLEKSFVVLENIKKSDETVEEFLNSIPLSLKKAIFCSQRARHIHLIEEDEE